MDLGEIKAHRGRWTWPFAEMLEGEHFRVDQLVRPKGAIANMAYVRGNVLGRRFSVTDDPDHSGYTRVTCVSEDVTTEVRTDPVRTMYSYEEATKLFERFYDPGDVEELRQYAGILQNGERKTVEASWVREPSVRQFVVTTSFNPDRTLVELKEGVVEITGKLASFKLEEWQREQLLAD